LALRANIVALDSGIKHLKVEKLKIPKKHYFLKVNLYLKI